MKTQLPICAPLMQVLSSSWLMLGLGTGPWQDLDPRAALVKTHMLTFPPEWLHVASRHWF